jgi:hypothetical protein
MMAIHRTPAQEEGGFRGVRLGLSGVLILLLVLALIGGGLWGLWLLGAFFWRVFAASPPAAQAAILAGAAATVVLALCLLRIGNASPGATPPNELRAPKAEFYEEFLQSLVRTMEGSQGGRRRRPEQAVTEFLHLAGCRLVVWGSDEVVRDFALLATLLEHPGSAEVEEIIEAYDDLIFSIRRDLGYANLRLDGAESWRTIFPDHPRSEG